MADDTSFIQKLRMNNIFPPQGNPSPLIGMPNFYSGRRQPIIHQNQPAIQQIAQQVAKPADPYGATYDVNGKPFKDISGKIQGGAPMNYAYDAPRSDEYGTQILMGNTEADKQRKAKDLLGEKTDAKQGDLIIKQRKQALAEKVAAGKATDAEKAQYALDLEDEKQSGRMSLQGAKSDTQYGIQGMKSSDAYGLQDIKGNQALEQISSRVAGQKDVNANKTTKSPTEFAPARNMDTRVKAQQLMTDRPDLAQYLSIDQNGRTNINPNTPLNELAMIQSALYPKGTQSDINLPSESKATEAPAKSTKPTAADLIKKYGG